MEIERTTRGFVNITSGLTCIPTAGLNKPESVKTQGPNIKHKFQIQIFRNSNISNSKIPNSKIPNSKIPNSNVSNSKIPKFKYFESVRTQDQNM